MSLSDERVKCFAARCADLGKELGVNVVDLYTLFHEQPVRCFSVTVNSSGSREGARSGPPLILVVCNFGWAEECHLLYQGFCY